ncbi:MAG: alpha/beta hydrolase [Polyangiaceae bacterium]
MRRLALGVLSLAAALAPGAGCGGGITEHDGVSYDDRFGDSTIMDVYVPEDGAATHPGVLFIHGGGWSGGSRAEYSQAASRLARSGYVTATIEYRLVPGGEYPKDVQDCLCALSFFRAQANEYTLDPKRVAIWGYSAGGHLVSLIGMAASAGAHQPDCASGPTYAPAAVITGAGLHDFRDMNPSSGVIHDYLGGSRDEQPDHYRDASPMAYLHADAPPYLFINGGSDWFVSADQAYGMRDALRALGNDATLLEVKGGGHLLNSTADPGDVTIETSDGTSEAWLAAIDFLDRTVGSP